MKRSRPNGCALFAVVCFAHVIFGAPAQSVEVTAEVAKILAEDGDSFDSFGASVSLDGERLAIGAEQDEDQGLDSGSVYLYERDGSGAWVEVAQLSPLDAQAGETFGNSVSLDDDRVAIGARREKELGFEAGAAYIFDRQGDGTWQQTAKLLGQDLEGLEHFGESISLDGDRVLVGAEGGNNGATDTGAAYVFDLLGGSWQQVAKLVPVGGENGDEFGWSASLEGSQAVVGAGRADSGGAAYVFELQGDGSWLQTAELLPSESETFFGRAVSIDTDRVVVGAYFSDGAAYVFERSGGSWSETARLQPLDAATGDQFGFWVSLEGDQLAVGANEEEDNGPNAGAAYLFTHSGGGSWQKTDKLTALDGAAGDTFASALSLNGGRLAIASVDDDDNQSDSGAVYFFEPVDVDPVFTVSGACPGAVELLVAGATPRNLTSIYRGAATGSGVITNPPCSGTVTGLDAPSLARSQNTGFAGAGSVVRTVSQAQCGTFLQLLDERTCLLSDVVEVP